MTQLGEAIARYHKNLEQDRERTAAWIGQLREQFEARHLTVNGRPVTPVLRPHFISRRQYSSLTQTAESLTSAIQRIHALALSTPQVMARMVMLPAEKMLATVDPGYSFPAVASLIDAQVNNGSLHLTSPQADMPHGVVYAEMLSELFFETPPVKELRKRVKLVKAAVSKPLVTAILKAWKDFGGKNKPTVGIVEFRQPFTTIESHEYTLLAELLRTQGLDAVVVSPEQLDYRNDVLRGMGLPLDVVLRGVRAHEFLLKYDLTHPLMRAYRDHRVCVVNSFRTEMTRKRALLALLTDESLTSSFPLSERKAIRETIPVTRVVAQGRVAWLGESVDLVDYISKNRASLVLRPNEDTADLHSTDGAQVDDATWRRALQQALRSPYVVQQRLDGHALSFPIDQDGEVAYRNLAVEVSPHAFLGKVHGCSARISAQEGAYSSVAGLVPAFILESR